MNDTPNVLADIPSPEEIRKRLEELTAEIRLLRGLLKLAEAKERLRGKAP